MDCVEDDVTETSVCTIEGAVTSRLHGTIAEVANYLEDRHLATSFVAYHYRTNYLPNNVSGNDVAALTRIAKEAQVRGVNIPPVFGPIMPAGDRESVSSEDVEYVAQYADDFVVALESVWHDIISFDHAHGVGPHFDFKSVLIIAGVGFGVGWIIGKVIQSAREAREQERK